MTSWRWVFCDKVSPGSVPGLEETDDEFEEAILQQDLLQQHETAPRPVLTATVTEQGLRQG